MKNLFLRLISKKLRVLFQNYSNSLGYTLKVGRLFGVYHKQSQEFIGVALWQTPEFTATQYWEMIKVGIPLGIFQKDGVSDTLRTIQAFDTFDKYRVKLLGKTPYWRINSLGVLPQWQRQGIGSNLLAPILEGYTIFLINSQCTVGWIPNLGHIRKCRKSPFLGKIRFHSCWQNSY